MDQTLKDIVTDNTVFTLHNPDFIHIFHKLHRSFDDKTVLHHKDLKEVMCSMINRFEHQYDWFRAFVEEVNCIYENDSVYWSRDTALPTLKDTWLKYVKMFDPTIKATHVLAMIEDIRKYDSVIIDCCYAKHGTLRAILLRQKILCCSDTWAGLVHNYLTPEVQNELQSL
jgi:hypothetical protein